jgi:thiamine monophosphate synthase
MGRVLVKCSIGAGCVEEKQDQKIAAFGSSYVAAGLTHFPTDEKKGLAKQDLS